MIAVDILTGVLVLVAAAAMVLMAWIGVLGALGAVRMRRCPVCGHLLVRGRAGEDVGWPHRHPGDGRGPGSEDVGLLESVHEWLHDRLPHLHAPA